MTTVDYLPAVDPQLEEEAVVRSCEAGALPYVADIELERLPPEPYRCP